MNLQNFFDGRLVGQGVAPAAQTAVAEAFELASEPESNELSFSDDLAIDFLRHGLLA